MLQIIGWLGCFYLVVKALEIFASNNFRQETGKLKESAIYAVAIALAGAVSFAIWLSDQGSAFPMSAATNSTHDELSESIAQQCVKFAKTPEAAAECVK